MTVTVGHQFGGVGHRLWTRRAAAPGITHVFWCDQTPETPCAAVVGVRETSSDAWSQAVDVLLCKRNDAAGAEARGGLFRAFPGCSLIVTHLGSGRLLLCSRAGSRQTLDFVEDDTDRAMHRCGAVGIYWLFSGRLLRTLSAGHVAELGDPMAESS